jgi:hypothetical protein
MFAAMTMTRRRRVAAQNLTGASKKKNSYSKKKTPPRSQVLYGSTLRLCSYLTEGVH